MNYLRSALITLLFIVAISVTAFCQKTLSGYVILANNDTVKSEFKSPLSALKYRPLNSTGKYKKMMTDDIKEFYVSQDTLTYEAILPGRGLADPLFLKRLEQGAMNLYEYDEAWSLNQASIIPGKIFFWYVSKINKPLTELKSGNFLYDSSRSSRKASFTEMISDAPEVAEQFKSEKSFDLNTLRRYVRMYNINKASTPVQGIPIK